MGDEQPADLDRFAVRVSSPGSLLGHYVDRESITPHVAICGRHVPHDVARPRETPICHICWRKAHPT